MSSLAVSVLSLSLAMAAEPPPVVPERLASGQTIERDIARGERHAFRVSLAAGEILLARLSALGLSVDVRLAEVRDGQAAPGSIRETQAYPRYPPISFCGRAAQAGDLELEIVAMGGSRGRYTLSVETRAPQPADLTRLDAQTAFTEGYGQMRSGRAGLVKAAERFQIAVAGYEEIGDLSQWAESLGQLASAQYRLQDMAGSSASYDTLLARLRGTGLLEADALYNRAQLHLHVGELQQALARFNDGLRVARAAGAELTEGMMLAGLGQVYSDLGDDRKSLGFREQALVFVAKEGHMYYEAALLEKVAQSRLKLEHLPEARAAFTRALALWHDEIGDPRGEATALHGMGQLHYALGDIDAALEFFQRAIPLKKQAHTPQSLASTQLEIARCHERRGALDASLAAAQEAQKLLEGVPGHSLQWKVLAHVARVERDRGRLADARRWAESAVALVEAGRAGLASEGLRNAYSAVSNGVYDLYVDILMLQHKAAPEAGHDRAALEASERGRARSLREMLREAKVTVAHGLDEGLVSEERRLREALARAAEAPRAAKAEAAPGPTIDALAADYETVAAKIRAANPQYAALMQLAPVAAAELQKRLPPGTVLLEYDLARLRSYLWTVSASGVRSYTLPGEEEIAPLARRLHEALSARNHVKPGTRAADRRRELAAAEKEAANAAAALSGLLLAPVPDLQAHQRLLVVPDGVLHYVPFAALPAPGSSEALIARHEILHLPSAAVAAMLRPRSGHESAAKSVAVFADPVFEKDDPRVASVGPRATARGVAPGSAVFSGSGDDLHVFHEATMDAERLARLAYTRTLSETVTRDLDAAHRLVATDFDASRDTVARSALDKYRIVMFATHGILNSEHPELSGIALSMVDKEGRSQDGFLRLQDIYHLDLDADLVVLGACETGLGKEVLGEGLVGLSRGFFYAGAARVLASVWKVDEQATVELLKELHRGVQKDGLSYPAALRQAQRRLMARPRFQSPYFWAGFILQGDWR